MDDLEKWMIIRFTSHKTIHPFFQIINSAKYVFFCFSFFQIIMALNLYSAAFKRNNSIPTSFSVNRLLYVLHTVQYICPFHWIRTRMATLLCAGWGGHLYRGRWWTTALSAS